LLKASLKNLELHKQCRLGLSVTHAFLLYGYVFGEVELRVKTIKFLEVTYKIFETVNVLKMFIFRFLNVKVLKN
jgi:hypothetical protein